MKNSAYNGECNLKCVSGKVRNMVQKAVDAFVVYLRDVKKTSHNTEMSYKRDLNKMCSFLEEKGIDKISQVN